MELDMVDFWLQKMHNWLNYTSQAPTDSTDRTPILRTRSSFSCTKQAEEPFWMRDRVYAQCAERGGIVLETAGGYTLVISCNLRGGPLLTRSNILWTNIAHTSSSQGRTAGQSGKVSILNCACFFNFNENSKWLADLIRTNQLFLHIER